MTLSYVEYNFSKILRTRKTPFSHAFLVIAYIFISKSGLGVGPINRKEYKDAQKHEQKRLKT